MIDLRGIARHLRLSVDQIRVAAELLEQGYQPSFIERYRADETGCLPRSTLWMLKLEIDRQQRLEAARERAKHQLPKESVLDGEATKYLEQATTEVEVDTVLRAFRARRALELSQERDGTAGQLLEKLIAYQGPAIEDMDAWVSQQMSVDTQTASQILDQSQKLVGALVQCDTGLSERLRRMIQRKAQIEVEFCEASHEDKGNDEPTSDSKTEDANAGLSDESADSAQDVESEVLGAGEIGADENLVSSSEAAATTESATTESVPAEVLATEAVTEGRAGAEVALVQEIVEPATVDPATVNPATVEPASAEGQVAASGSPVPVAAHEPAEVAGTDAALPAQKDQTAPSISFAKAPSKSKKDASAKAKSAAKKLASKMTPRQRRRRWLIAMLQPMKAIKRPVTKLTAYQQLMLGRGRRSQLVRTHLTYDKNSLKFAARDTFVNDKHPLAKWFEQAVSSLLEQSWQSKMEADALADLEEQAQERLLETAADQLRQSLMRRPVRGHVIMVIDTVGPKSVSVAIVDPNGKVLATDEIPCSAHPNVVSQNVIQLGQLAHRHRVTLVALTNGPARRFLILTLRELVKQSASSGLRWTMADRGGAEAYAAGRTALKELAANNRRDRAAIWVARALQDPMRELLKVDINRLRLGSYQRELPQEPLKKLVRETISDCVSSMGIDVHRTNIDELLCVSGVGDAQAQQIATLSVQGQIVSRKQLLERVSDWPEVDARRSIGFLRVFNSEQVFDGTLIHPDDYRLAERLVSNTELELPPAAPENWSKPEPIRDLAVKHREIPPAEPLADDSASTADAEQAPNEEAQVAQTDQRDTAEPAAHIVQPAEAGDAILASVGESPVTEVVADQQVPEPSNAEPSNAEPSNAESSNAVPSNAEMETLPPADETPPSSAAKCKPEYSEDAIDSVGPGLTLDVEKLARSWQVGRAKLRQIANCLHSPFDDARLTDSPVPMLAEMPTLSSLTPGKCLWAVVVGVADFGAFVEIAPDCSGLIHISRLSADYVEDPHQVVQVGDLLLTWVVSVDEKKSRVALTTLSPAQRVAAEAAANQRSEETRDRGEQRGRRSASQGENNPRGTTQRAGSSANTGQREGAARDSGGNRASKPGAPRSSGSPGTATSGRRDDSRGGGNRGRSDQGGRAGRSGGGRQSHPVIVVSKKPKAVISEAMKEGEEPLRSFSDLLQFYEAKRTDAPPPPKVVETLAGPVEPAKDQSMGEQPATEPKSSDPLQEPVQDLSANVQEE